MNVNEVGIVESTTNYWMTIFNRQRELIDKYNKIEAKVMNIPQLYENVNWESLDNQVTQLKIKEMLWRTIEEIGESYECVQNIDEDDKVDRVHQLEELADALHFFVELLIHLGYKSDDLSPLGIFKELYIKKYSLWEEHEFYVNGFTALGKIGNCLKNKPWKQSQIRTDQIYMKKCIYEFLKWLLFIFFTNDFKEQDIYEMYMKKSQVNKFRQNTNY